MSASEESPAWGQPSLTLASSPRPAAREKSRSLLRSSSSLLAQGSPPSLASASLSGVSSAGQPSLISSSSSESSLTTLSQGSPLPKFVVVAPRGVQNSV